MSHVQHCDACHIQYDGTIPLGFTVPEAPGFYIHNYTDNIYEVIIHYAQASCTQPGVGPLMVYKRIRLAAKEHYCELWWRNSLMFGYNVYAVTVQEYNPRGRVPGLCGPSYYLSATGVSSTPPAPSCGARITPVYTADFSHCGSIDFSYPSLFCYKALVRILPR